MIHYFVFLLSFFLLHFFVNFFFLIIIMRSTNPTAVLPDKELAADQPNAH